MEGEVHAVEDGVAVRGEFQFAVPLGGVLVDGKPEGLRGLLSAGLMDRQGIASAVLKDATAVPGSALEPWKVVSYRSSSRVAVELNLLPPAGGRLWVAEGASLEDAQGRPLSPLLLWQEASSDGLLRLIVEAEAPASEAQGSYRLKLWEAGGQHSSTVEGVTFP